MDDRDMRALLAEAFRRAYGREATRVELQCLQAVAWLETSYGMGWKGTGIGSNNFGAMQAGAAWHGATFLYTDTHPNADGTSTPYTVAFRKYPTAIAGAEDFLRIVYTKRPSVLAAASRGDIDGFSAALHATRYYEGFGRTVGERIAHHFAAVVKAIQRQCKALGEELPPEVAALPQPRPTLREGASGLDVRDLQAALNRQGASPALAVDGSFGRKTRGAVEGFQTRRGLKVDGVVGPMTWKELGENE